MRSGAGRRRLGLALAAASLATGCALLGVREQRAAFERFARIRGEARLDAEGESPIVVVLGRPGPDAAVGWDEKLVVDHYRLERAGSFAFAVSPGRYRLLAFADLNANLVCDAGEPLLADAPPFELAPGESLDGLELVIPRAASRGEPLDLLARKARTPKDQEHFSLGRFTARGEVALLGDARFGPASGPLGMWRFVDFLFEVRPGIYFLEEYDPNEIPVLFVHGLAGYPQQFAALVEKLDRSRFQPWFYAYPSGIHLDVVARHLAQVVAELQRQHGFDELALVAHSMGGLVARAFLFEAAERKLPVEVPVFVAISTPWGGSEDARNIERAPRDFMVFSWFDMSPSSAFLRGLFYEPPDYARARALPGRTDFHMLFGYRRRERSRGPSSDGTVSVRSQARPEALDAARTILPLDEDHLSILSSASTAARLAGILEDAFADEPFWPPSDR